MTLRRCHIDNNEPPHCCSRTSPSQPADETFQGPKNGSKISASPSVSRRQPLTTMCWPSIFTSVLLLSTAASATADQQSQRDPGFPAATGANGPKPSAQSDDGQGTGALSVVQWVECPSPADNSACPCHKIEGGK